MDKKQMRLLALVALCCMTGCVSMYAGIGAHAESTDRPGVTTENPIGMVGLRTKTHPVRLVMEHHSSLLVRDRGHGYNVIMLQIESN